MTDSLQKLLQKNQPKSNQNPKFSDSSPVASVFARLGFDFVPSDPTILDLSEGAKKHLQQTPKMIKDWQAEDMRNGTANRENYFKNPVFDISKALQNNLQKIRDAIPKYAVGDEFSNVLEERSSLPELSGVFEQANVSITQIQQYIDHTDRISNVSEYEPGTENLPYYQQALAVGRQLLYIVYQTDNVQNNAPILGSFTSLFVGPELQSFNDTIETYPFIVANSIYYIDMGELGVQAATNLTSTQIETITNNIKSVRNFVDTRRKHDENFWKKAQAITDEYQLLKNMNEGETQKMLIEQYIGTPELIEKQEIKDVPVLPRYNVEIAYDGTIVYTPREGANASVITYPSFDDRTEPIYFEVDYFEDVPDPQNITSVVDTYEQLPKNPNIDDTCYIFDTCRSYRWNGLSWYRILGHVIADKCYVRTTGVTYYWTGTEWSILLVDSPTSPTKTLDEYITIYSSNSTNVVLDGGYAFNLSVGAFIFTSNNGIWSANANVTILNTGTKDYNFTGVSVVNFLNSELRYSLNVVGTNTIFYSSDTNILGTVNVGNSLIFTVSARNLSDGNTLDYGKINIIPGIQFPVKVISNTASYGILLPSSVSQNVGSPTSRLLIDEVNGPYRLLAANSSAPDYWTWRNDSNSSVTISSITDITPNTHNTDMTIEFYQATTPNTLNVNDSVLWYANVTPHVEFPNTFTYIVETSDGQQRLLTIGVDRGNVNDSNLYNEVLNTNPDIVVTNNFFDIRVYGGKPNTFVTLSGPNISGTKQLDANGYSLVANTKITSNGTYTYVVDFAGTGHRRTVTKAIFS